MLCPLIQTIMPYKKIVYLLLRLKKKKLDCKSLKYNDYFCFVCICISLLSWTHLKSCTCTQRRCLWLFAMLLYLWSSRLYKLSLEFLEYDSTRLSMLNSRKTFTSNFNKKYKCNMFCKIFIYFSVSWKIIIHGFYFVICLLGNRGS